MNSMNKPIDEASNEADSMAARVFNAKFESYFGKDKTAKEVRQLISLVLQHNSNESNHIIGLLYYGKLNGNGQGYART